MNQLAAPINPVPPNLQDAIAIHVQGNLSQAEEIYRRLLVNEPQNADLFNLLGVIAHQTGRFSEAVQLIGNAIAIDPSVASFHLNEGTSLKALQQLEASIESFERAIALNPDYAEAYYNRGNALRGLKHFEAAIASYDKAITLKPDYANAYLNRGISLQELEKVEAALASYDLAITHNPNTAEAHCNRGMLLKKLKYLDEAVAAYDRAIALKPHYVEAHYNQGNALNELKQFDEAVISYDKAIALKPDYAEAFLNRGISLHALKQVGAALASYDKAISLNPNFAEAYFNCANALNDLKHLDNALAFYTQSINLNPDFVEAYVNRGNLLKELKQLDAALKNYDIAFDLNPDQKYLFGMRQQIKMQMCDWDDFEINVLKLSQKIQNNEKASPCLPLLALPLSLAAKRKAAEIFIADNFSFNPTLGPIPKHKRREKIRIGYYSADFHKHATTYLMAEMLEMHDKDKFEVFAFSFGPDRKDEMQKRVSQAVTKFIDVTELSDKSVAQMSRDLGIDIAVDLKGLTKDTRLGIFSYRCAPLQVSYLGYPGTLGAYYMDYLIADKTLIPQASQTYYSEKIIYLPDSYQVNDRQRAISNSKFTRQDMGLPEEGFVFCSFNNNYKIIPLIFDSWMRILKEVESSVLWLFEDNSTAVVNLQKEARSRGIDPCRLVFAKRLHLPEHLARHKLASLFLDTLPYNAHTTASDALWAGLPVVTCMSDSFASRVAASLLFSIGLPELVTHNIPEYEALAIELATNSAKLKAIKEKLDGNRMTSPLFDSKRFTQHLEKAYEVMHESYQADSPLGNIYIH